MGVPGNIVTAAEAARGIESVRHLAGALYDAGLSASRDLATAAPTLTPIPRSLMDVTAGRLARELVWTNDGWCTGRAALGAALVQEAATGSVAFDDAVHAAMAVTEVPVTMSTRGGKVEWSYHAATAVQPSDAREPFVIDYLLHERPVPLSTWRRNLGVGPDQVKLHSPLDVRGLSVGGSPLVAAERYEEALVDAWTKAKKGGAVDEAMRGAAAVQPSLAEMKMMAHGNSNLRGGDYGMLFRDWSGVA